LLITKAEKMINKNEEAQTTKKIKEENQLLPDIE
jgi:hypothetical protein